MNTSFLSSNARLALSPLLAPFSSLEGIGPKLSELLYRAVNGKRVIDLLFHLPTGIIDRRYRPLLKDVIAGNIATLKLNVSHIEKPKRSKQPWHIYATDNTGNADIVLFSQWQARKISPQSTIFISGIAERNGKHIQFTNPHYVENASKEYNIPLIEPVWPLTAGLFSKNLQKALKSAFNHFTELPEWITPSFLKTEQWPSFKEALHLLHFPSDFAHLFEHQHYDAAASRARTRLAFDELLADQLALGRARRSTATSSGRSLIGNQRLITPTLQRFGFTLTQSQIKAFNEIKHDLERPNRMLRLLQGDVGSGKTIVALMAALQAVEAGYQAAIMAPTEILATQHYTTFASLTDVKISYLSSSIKGKSRKEVLSQIESGESNIIVGTHALFQESVSFKNLSLVIIDEQHRFGVEQRLRLGDKGQHTDVLVMTATPIPRTLLLTRWGELQMTRIEEKPIGRKPVQTSLHSLNRLDKLLEGLRRALEHGSQIFWVCPLIEESEVLDLAAAEDRFHALQSYFGPSSVGLAHGRQESHVRQQALEDFQKRKTSILVATTVIEVGVDIPNASIMIIEHAERFGLAQLHQLRGRVGRGNKQSYCLLLHDEPLSYIAKRRLSLLRETEDGFKIADEDFRLRGSGEATGKRQSGLPDYKLADEIRIEQWLTRAHQYAETLLHNEKEACPEQMEATHCLLLLFDKEKTNRLLRSG